MGGSTQKAPTPYQPPNQAGAAAAFQTGAGQLASAGSALYGQVAPELSSIAGNVINNPYYAQALQGAQQAASTATSTVAPQQFAGAGQDTQIANLAALSGPQYAASAKAGGQRGYQEAQSLLPQTTGGAALAPGIYNQAEAAIPATTGGAGYAPNILQGLGQAGTDTYNALTGLAPSLTQGGQYAEPALAALAGGGAATYGADMQALQNLGTTGLQAGNAVIGTGFDPQQALYNRSYQQMLDQQNAINAQSGVAGSPYAAGVTGTAAQNFNIDWQNAQLQRQIAALGAYDQAASTYAGNTANLSSGAIGNLATGINSGVQDYNALTGTAAGNAATLYGTGAGSLANLVGTGVNAYTGLTSNTANNLATLQNAAVGGYDALTGTAASNASNLIGAGSSALNSGISTAAGAQSTLGNLALAANQGASELGTAGLNTIAGAAQLPQDIYLQQQQAALAAIGAQISGTNASLAPTQQAVADYGNYLNIGQTASQGAIQAAQVNNQAAQASAAGFGNLFGGIVGMLAFA